MGLVEIVDHLAEDEVDELKPGTTLFHEQYTITRFLNNGGFGITYLAKDSLDRNVVIKECFSQSFCRRSQTHVSARSRAYQGQLRSIIRSFIREAHSLSKLKHANIVGVHQVFEDNGTAYMAIDFVDGKDLLELIEDPQFELKPDQIVSITRKLLSAIKYVHQHGLLHRDISPDNILIDQRGEPILIDFGAAREDLSATDRKHTALHVVKDGYSPQEFYIEGSVQSPCSDLYALAASLYHLIKGEAPINSQVRLVAMAEASSDPYVPLAGAVEGYPPCFLEAIDKAMVSLPAGRQQSADEWLEMLDAPLRAATADASADRPATDGQSKGTLFKTVSILAVIAALGIGGYTYFAGNDPVKTAENDQTAAGSNSDSAAEDAALIAAEQEAARLAAEQEAARLTAELEASRNAAEQEAVRVAAEQEAARAAAEQETARLAAELEAARAVSAQEVARVAEEQEAARLAAEQEAARLAAELEATRAAAEQEAVRVASEQEASRLVAEEKTAQLAAELAAARTAAEQEAARLAAELVEARTISAQEAERVAAEQEEARVAAEKEEARVAAEQEAARIAAEEEAARLAVELETVRVNAEKEVARVASEQEAARVTAEQEAARLAAELEASRSAADEEAARVAAEQKAARLEAEQKTAQLAAELEAARTAAEQESARLAAELEEARAISAKEAERVAAEQEAARIAAEQEAARVAAEQEAARVAAEQKAARVAVEQKAARVATEQKTARVSAAQKTTGINAAQTNGPVIDATSVMSGTSASLPFTVDQSEPTLIQSTSPDAPSWLKPGSKVVSVNGIPVQSVGDIQRVIKMTSAFKAGDEVDVTFGVENRNTNDTLVRSIRLQTVTDTVLLNGTRFQTRLVDGSWITTVTASSGRKPDELNKGDALVAYMATNEKIDGQNTMSSILKREFSKDTPSLSFAVNRDDRMWLVSMPNLGLGTR